MIREDGTIGPTTVMLCSWADDEPDKLMNTPRWLQRSALAGHLLNYPDDCAGCPCFDEQRTKGCDND